MKANAKFPIGKIQSNFLVIWECKFSNNKQKYE
jgi:hypothetical protein